MKIKNCFALALLLSSGTAFSADKIILRNPVIEFIDGASFGINGEVIGFMLKVRHKVLALIETTEATPTLSDNPTVDELITILRELEAAAQKLADYTHRSNKAILDHKPVSAALTADEIKEYTHLQEIFSLELLAEIENIIINSKNQRSPDENKELMDAKQNCLKSSRLYFHEIVEPFIIHALGAKAQMLSLIEESCIKRHRPNSLLRGWGAAPEGTEVHHFDLDIVNFNIYKLFCHDLGNFLEDLMRSCPRGLTQFKKIVQNEKQKHKK